VEGFDLWSDMWSFLRGRIVGYGILCSPSLTFHFPFLPIKEVLVCNALVLAVKFSLILTGGTIDVE